MKRFFYVGVLIASLFITFSSRGQSQPQTSDREQAVKVFIDCHYCDHSYIKREIPYINYVRDRKLADIHLLVTRQQTGSGGNEYIISFIGLNRFEGDDDELVYHSMPDESGDETREGRTQIIKMGLMKYVAKTPMRNEVVIDYHSNKKANEEKELFIEDKWKSWVFELGLSGEYEGEDSYKSSRMRTSFSGERITPDWRVEFNGRYDDRLNKYYYDDDEYISRTTSSRLNHLLVKSIGDHWAVGEGVHLNSSSYSNNRFSYSFYPAVEYNLFPYQESDRKQLRFHYSIGYGYTYYRDTTIYDKIEEGLFRHSLSISLAVKQPWGSVYTSLTGANYLHDFSKNNLRLKSSIYFRLVKGLSLRLSGNFSIIHDQLSLAKEAATEEEILLRITQLASQYDYGIEAGISYTFGAIYNNVVNPRFGR